MFKAIKNKTRINKGFTIIELTLVMGILAILTGIVLVAINPFGQYSQANDTKRQNDVNAIFAAIGQYQEDNNGSLPPGLTTNMASTEISSSGADICSSLVPKYLAALPEDPSINNGQDITVCSSYDTGYTISVGVNNRITVSAVPQVAGNVITVSR